MYDNSVRMYAESLPQHCCHGGDWLAVLDGHRWGQFASQAVSTFEVPVVQGVGGRLPQKSRLGVIVCITLCEACWIPTPSQDKPAPSLAGQYPF